MLFQVPLVFRILFSWENSYPKEDKFPIYGKADEIIARYDNQVLLA